MPVYAPTNQCGTVQVTFQNTSRDFETSTYLWNYGNGSASTGANPLPQTYMPSVTQDTTYTVELSMVNSCDTQTKSVEILVKHTPKPDFIFEQDTICTDFPLRLYNHSLGEASRYEWDFGDGSPIFTTVDKGSLTHAFPHVGRTGFSRYPVRLSAYNDCGVATYEKEIIVTPNLVEADFEISTDRGCAPLTIDFESNQGGFTDNELLWIWGDGQITADEDHIEHTFQNAGKYQVSFIVKSGCSIDTMYRDIEVFESPLANFTVSQDTICIGQEISFDNLSSPTPLLSHWDFGNGTFISATNSPTKSYADIGTYFITLTVENPISECTHDTSLVVRVIEPTPDFEIPTVTCQNNPATFQNRTVGGDLYRWYFGDDSAHLSDENPTYTFTSAGDMEVKLVATNSVFGCADSITQTVTVEPLPVPDFTFTSIACQGNEVRFQENSPTGVEFIWTFPDGSTQMGAVANHIFMESGVFNIQLKVKSAIGCYDSLTKTIRIDTAPSVGSWGDNRNICALSERLCIPDTTGMDVIWKKDGVEITENENKRCLEASETGKYEVLVTNRLSGCSNTNSIELYFYDTPQFKVFDTPTGVDTIVCASDEAITFIETISSKGDLKFIKPNTADTTSHWDISAYEVGDNVVSVTAVDTTGCEITQDVTISVIAVPTINLQDTMICNYDSAKTIIIGKDLTHSKSLKYQWRNISFYNTALKDSVISTDGNLGVSREGKYELTITDTLTGCAVRDTAEVLFNAVPDFNILGYDGTRCARFDTLRLDQTNLGNYQVKWTTNEGEIIGSSDSLQVVVGKTGWYEVTVTDTLQSSGCSFTSAIYVINHAPPTVSVSDTTICKSDSVAHLVASDLAHGENIKYEWARVETPDEIISTEPILAIDSSGTYIIFVRDSLTSCTASDTATATIHDVPKVEILGNDSVLCVRTDTLYLAQTNFKNMQIQWHGEGIIRRSDTLSVIVEKTGTYWVTVKDTSNHKLCELSDTIWVNIFANPEISIPQDTMLCSRQPFFVNAYQPSHAVDATYRWKRILSDKTHQVDSSALWIDFLELQTFDPVYYEVTVNHPSTGCWSRDTLQLQFGRNAGSEILSPPQQVCQHKTVDFTAGEAVKWAYRTLGNHWVEADSSQFFNLTFHSAGIYEVRLRTNSNNRCGFNEQIIRVYAISAPKAEIPAEILSCQTSAIQIDAKQTDHRADVRYQWKILLSQDTTLFPNSSLISVNYDSLWMYEAYLTPDIGLDIELTVSDLQTGCAAKDTTRIFFERQSTAELIEDDFTICLGETVKLEDRNGANFYKWRTRSLPDSVLEHRQIFNFTPTFEGTFLMDLHSFNDSICAPVVSQARITVNPLPPIQAHQTDTVEICLGDTAYLFPSDTLATWTHDGSTLYEIVAENQFSCQQMDGVYVKVHPNPELPELENVEYICQNSFRRISMPENYAQYYWTRNGSFAGDSSFLDVWSIGFYTVQVTNKQGCMTEKAFEVNEIKVLPEVDILGDSTVCATGSGARLEAPEGFTFYRWIALVDSVTSEQSGSYIYQTENEGKYWLEVTDDFGCKNIDSVNVTECCAGRVVGMNDENEQNHPIAISPNALDSRNHQVQFEYQNVLSVHVRTYNRSGILIFDEERTEVAENLDEPVIWDGTFNDKLQPQGSYHAVVEYVDCKNQQLKNVKFSQTILLIDTK